MGRNSCVLLIDDDEDYRHLFASALQETGLCADLVELKDGSAAINYLLGNQPYADRAKFPLPDLVFLDLKMPGKDGFDVLNEIRKNLGQQELPIIVLTNSSLKNDIAAAYSSHASAFHQKPFDYRDLVSLLRTVIPLWLDFGAPEIQRDIRKPSDPGAEGRRFY